nr:M20/M25/M40 family metallo-hydrolase [uncultured Flavobacterium sp.]
MIKLYVNYFIKCFNLLNYKHLILYLLFFYSISTHSQQLTNAQPENEIEKTIKNSDEIAQHLSEAIQIKTISNQNSSQINSESFVALKENLIKNFPNVFEYLHQEKFSSNSILLKWEGKDISLKPILLMAHQDVVPAEDQISKWKFPPFSGQIHADHIYGRGALDDKSSLIGLLEAAENLLKKGFKPERTIYFAFGDDEEIGGNGAKEIANWFIKNNINLEFILDEGPGVGIDVIDEVKKPIALIGVAEKGYASVELSVDQISGHSSMPPKKTAIGILSKAINNIEDHPFPARYDGAIKMLFDEIAPEMSFYKRFVFQHSSYFETLIKTKLSLNNSTNALIRTTSATTLFHSGEKENILPNKASAIINFRILPGDSLENIVPYINKVVNDSRVKIMFKGAAYNASPIADLNSLGYQLLSKSCKEIYPEAIVAPILVIGSTDSRYFTKSCNNILRFIPMYFHKENLELIHGMDEEVNIKDYKKLIQFYIRMMENL